MNIHPSLPPSIHPLDPSILLIPWSICKLLCHVGLGRSDTGGGVHQLEAAGLRPAAKSDEQLENSSKNIAHIMGFTHDMRVKLCETDEARH